MLSGKAFPVTLEQEMGPMLDVGGRTEAMTIQLAQRHPGRTMYRIDLFATPALHHKPDNVEYW
jgi:hypothetical protein